MIVRVFAGGLPHLSPEWQALLAFVAATSMIVGNLLAIAQTSLKRLLAYSGIAQAGYILVGVIAGYTWLVVLAVLMSVVSVYYYVRVLVPVWSPTARSDDLRAPLSTTAAIAISGVASILLGLYPTLILLESQVGVVPI